MQLSTTILSVQSRVTQGGRVLYDVACGDGTKRTVWEDALANSLNAYVNAGPVTLEVESAPSKDGRFQNHTIRSLVGPSNGVLVAPTVPTGSAQNLTPAPIQPAPQGGQFNPETTTRITKLACLSDACALVGNLMQGAGPEALEQATELVIETTKAFYSVARSHEAGRQPLVQQQSQTGQLVPPTTPAEVAAQVPGVTVGAPVEAPVEAPAASDDVSWD